jgi:hypothetical protein
MSPRRCKLDEYDEEPLRKPYFCRPKRRPITDLATYNYFLESEWLQYATTDGWGPFNNSRDSLQTYDFATGYGLSYSSTYSGYSKKLKRVYIYDQRIYTNPYANVIDPTTGNFINVIDAPGVKVRYQYTWD